MNSKGIGGSDAASELAQMRPGPIRPQPCPPRSSPGASPAPAS
jgi:hypothetical protein